MAAIKQKSYDNLVNYYIANNGLNVCVFVFFNSFVIV